MKNNEKAVKRQEEREERYQSIIARLTEQFSILSQIKEDTENIIEKMDK